VTVLLLLRASFPECSGHQSFSNNRHLNDLVGHLTHSSIMVPYHGEEFVLGTVGGCWGPVGGCCQTGDGEEALGSSWQCGRRREGCLREARLYHGHSALNTALPHLRMLCGHLG
jgi:hypothetical protein